MSLPSQEANAVCTVVRPIADLGLTATVTSAADQESTVFTTGAPRTIIVEIKLTSGSGTLKMDRADTEANVSYGSADVSLSLSGTSRLIAVLNTTSSESFVGIQLSSGSSMVIAEMVVLVVSALEDGEEWYNVRSAHNATDNTTLGDGSGVLDLAIA